MKAYTDIEQSKKLAEILPLESADMFYRDNGIDVKLMWEHNAQKVTDPCWSLAALLSVLPYPTLYQQRDGAWGLDVWVEQVKPYSVKNAICEVDACYEMIIKLKGLKKL